jgi:hypothetical protein
VINSPKQDLINCHFIDWISSICYDPLYLYKMKKVLHHVQVESLIKLCQITTPTQIPNPAKSSFLSVDTLIGHNSLVRRVARINFNCLDENYAMAKYIIRFETSTKLAKHVFPNLPSVADFCRQYFLLRSSSSVEK